MRNSFKEKMLAHLLEESKDNKAFLREMVDEYRSVGIPTDKLANDKLYVIATTKDAVYEKLINMIVKDKNV